MTKRTAPRLSICGLPPGAAADALDVYLAAFQPAAAGSPWSADESATVAVVRRGASGSGSSHAAGAAGGGGAEPGLPQGLDCVVVVPALPLEVARAAPLALAAVAGTLEGTPNDTPPGEPYQWPLGVPPVAASGAKPSDAQEGPGAAQHAADPAANPGQAAEQAGGVQEGLRPRYERLLRLLLRPRKPGGGSTLNPALITDTAADEGETEAEWEVVAELRPCDSNSESSPGTLPLLDDRAAVAAAQCPDARLAAAGVRALAPAGAWAESAPASFLAFS